MKPVILTSGEPSGVGPELALKAWDLLGERLPFCWIGDPRHLGTKPRIVEIETLDKVSKVIGDGMPVLRHAFARPAISGQTTPENAQGVIDVIERAVALVQSGDASAICTGPIHKKALQDGAGFAFPGHTEFLAHLAGVKRVVMMLASDQLRVVPTTIHIAIKDIRAALTADLIEDTIRITHAGLIKDFGLKNPRIAVAGLNPHAGEGGAMGNDEIDLITPLIDRLIEQGFNLTGPLPADTMFHARARKNYDAAICMYHDQALIPIKTLDFDRGVNVTLGLPFIRTSPDHGTAFDIAGKGIADPTSLIEALKMAQTMAKARGETHGD